SRRGNPLTDSRVLCRRRSCSCSPTIASRSADLSSGVARRIVGALNCRLTIYKCQVNRVRSAARLPLQCRDLTKERTGIPVSHGHQRRKRMILHDVKVHPSKDNLQREEQLAWKIAAVAADKVAVERDVAAMIIN